MTKIMTSYRWSLGLLISLQTVTRTFPSNLVINGAWPVTEETNPETVTWQWKTVEPTSLRQCEVYSKVGQQGERNLPIFVLIS